MKHNRNLFYLMVLLLIAIAAIIFFKVEQRKSPVGEQSMIGSSSSVVLTDLQSEVVKGFNEKDAAIIASLCDEEIQFTHGETDDFFTKEDTENYLKKFFLENPSKKFSIIHSGSNEAGTGYYLIGELEMESNKKLRVQISNNKKTIQSIEMNDSLEF